MFIFLGSIWEFYERKPEKINEERKMQGIIVPQSKLELKKFLSFIIQNFSNMLKKNKNKVLHEFFEELG